MLIKHVSILNTSNPVLTKDNFMQHSHTISFSLGFSPDEHWIRSFRYHWLKKTSHGRKTIDIMDNHLTLNLDGNDDIQYYIDLIKQLVQDIPSYAVFSDTSKIEIENDAGFGV